MPSDIEPCARLAESHDLGDAPAWAETFRATIDDTDGNRALFVAEVRERIVGYARTVRLTTPPDVEGRLPLGWYLLGVLVEIGSRRGGIGHRLTVSRIDWLRERTDTAYFYTAATNLASQRLHRATGFEPLLGDFILRASPPPPVTPQLAFFLNLRSS